MSTRTKTAAAPVETRLVVRNGSTPDDVALDALAREAGLHPDLVRRLIALGLLDRPAGRLFPRDAAPRLARAARLRGDLGLNYAGAILACQLLDRIEQLERRLRRYEQADRDRR
jgi:chaperone modulatory protein CbpM